MNHKAAAFALTFIFTSLSGCERYRLDRQMEELCKKDGGVKVYETVTLSPAEYEELSKYVVTKKSMEEYYGPDYRYVLKREIMAGQNNDSARGKGMLTRYSEALFRASDNHLLGENISYQRVGGDLFTFGSQPSGNHCPKPRTSLQKEIFLKGE